MFADDLKILHIGTPADQVQSNLDALEDWVTRNKMGLAIEKCAQLLSKGPEGHFHLCGSLLQTSAGVKDLGFRMQSDLTWKIHLEERMKKANRVFYSLRRNVAFKVNMRIKMGLFKSMILPVLIVVVVVVVKALGFKHKSKGLLGPHEFSPKVVLV